MNTVIIAKLAGSYDLDSFIKQLEYNRWGFVLGELRRTLAHLDVQARSAQEGACVRVYARELAKTTAQALNVAVSVKKLVIVDCSL